MKYLLTHLLVVLPLIVMPSAFADDALDKYKATLGEQLAQIDTTAKETVEKTNVTYLKMLLKLKEKVQQEGSLEKATAVVAEIKRFEADGVHAPKVSDVSELAEVQQAFVAELIKIDRSKKVSQRSMLKKYDRALEILQKVRVQDGDLDAAEAVRKERERASSAMPKLPDRVARKAGKTSLNVIVHGDSAHELRRAEVGVRTALDGKYKITAIPRELEGAVTVLRKNTKSPLEATVDQPCKIYLAFIANYDGKVIKMTDADVARLQKAGWREVKQPFSSTAWGNEVWTWRIMSKSTRPGKVTVDVMKRDVAVLCFFKN